MCWLKLSAIHLFHFYYSQVTQASHACMGLNLITLQVYSTIMLTDIPDCKKIRANRASVTIEGQGDVTCISLGDVTWSNCIHDVRDLSDMSEGSRRRKPHQKGQKPRLCPVMSARGVLLLWFQINGEQSAGCSCVNSTLMSLRGVCEGGGPLVLARRGAPVSTSTAVLRADLFCEAGWVTLLHGSEGSAQVPEFFLWSNKSNINQSGHISTFPHMLVQRSVYTTQLALIELQWWSGNSLCTHDLFGGSGQRGRRGCSPFISKNTRKQSAKYVND